MYVNITYESFDKFQSYSSILSTLTKYESVFVKVRSSSVQCVLNFKIFDIIHAATVANQFIYFLSIFHLGLVVILASGSEKCLIFEGLV